MTPEKRLAYEMLIAQNAGAVYAEKKKIEAARLEDRIDAIKKALLRDKLTVEEIAEDNNISVDFVLKTQVLMTQEWKPALPQTWYSIPKKIKTVASPNQHCHPSE